jgi:hypothetical protein
MNDDEFSYCRITQWHAAGFKGKGIKVAIHEVSESTCKCLSRWCGGVLDPFKEKFSGKVDTHAQNVIDTLLLVAPDVEIHLMGSNWLGNLQYCIDHGIDIYNYSATGSYNTSEFNALEQKALDAGVFFVCSTGNDGARPDGLTGFSRKKTWLSVGAVRWNVDKPLPNGYSSWDRYGDDLDVCGFADGLQIPSELNSDKLMGVSGSSFSCPWVVGLLALWKQKFFADNKRKPTFSETYKFAIGNAQDIEAPGYDQKTGYGVLRLQELPKEPKLDVIEMWSGKAIAIVNGEAQMLYTAPQLIAGRNMIGLRDVAELTGWKVEWDNTEKKITLIKEAST